MKAHLRLPSWRAVRWLVPLLAGALVASGCGNEQEVGTAKAGGPFPVPVDFPPVIPGGPAALGIDVSKYQGTIDWPTVKTQYDFAIIRVSDGLTYPDTKFDANWQNAKSAGVIRGTYQFFRASQDPVAQANYLLDHMGPLADGDIPPTLDIELTDGQSHSKILAGIDKWVARVQEVTGRRPIIYTSPGFWNPLGAPDEDGITTLWVAHWGVDSPSVPASWNDWTFWQYSDSGTVDGISGPVDQDIFNGSVGALQYYTAHGP